MLLRLTAYAALGLMGLYAAESAGLVPTRQYLPSLPRLERSLTLADATSVTTSGTNWASCLLKGQSLAACGISLPELGHGGSFTHRISAARAAESGL